MKTIRESEIQVMLADYLVVHYSKVIFHSDFGSGVKFVFLPGKSQEATKWRKENVARHIHRKTLRWICWSFY
jgi:hypothetical protein